VCLSTRKNVIDCKPTGVLKRIGISRSLVKLERCPAGFSSVKQLAGN